MKKILALLLALTLTGVLVVSAFAAPSPTPVITTDPVTGGTIAEYPDGTIIITIGDDTYTFTDIADHWGKDAICEVVLKQLMIGYPDGKFHPEDGLSAAMVYTVIARINDADIKTTGDGWIDAAVSYAQDNGFAIDVDPEATLTRTQMVDIFAAAEEAEGDPAEWAQEAGLLKGDENGDLMLDKMLTRAEFATVLVRYLAK